MADGLRYAPPLHSRTLARRRIKMRECWRCLEAISDDQRVCSYCGTDTASEIDDKDANKKSWLDRFKYTDLCSRLFWPALALLFLEAFTKFTRTVTNGSEWLLIYIFSAFIFGGVCRAVNSGVVEGKFYTTRRDENPAGFNMHINFGLIISALTFIIGTYELYKFIIRVR